MGHSHKVKNRWGIEDWVSSGQKSTITYLRGHRHGSPYSEVEVYTQWDHGVCQTRCWRLDEGIWDLPRNWTLDILPS